MSELLTVTDLEIAKKHDTFHSEVITGKAGGSATGANIYAATNAVTGQVQKTLPKVLQDVGFKPVSGSFQAGATITEHDQCLLDTSSGTFYSWNGALPKVVAAGSTPATAGGIGVLLWVDRTDISTINKLNKTIYLASEITDFTGATNYSTIINSLLTNYDVVKLPKTNGGFIRANITVPTGKTLLGSGAPLYDIGSAAWSPNGTLIKGTISATNNKLWVIGNLAVDAYSLGANGLQGVSDTTSNGYVKNVNTRANNHGQLWEQNSAFADGRNGGDIIVEDCIHYEGPNGFVSKTNNVSFIRCKAVSVTVQGFVVVSDNINGQGVFSKAHNTTIEDCEAVDCNTPIRIYSRNYHDGIDTVLASSLTKITRFKAGTPGGNHIRAGDFAATATSGGFARVLNEDIIIDGGYFLNAPYNAIHLEYVNRASIVNSPVFGSNGTSIAYGDTVYSIKIGQVQHVNQPAAGGLDLKYKIETGHASFVNLTGCPDVVVFNNASPGITVSATSGLTSVFNYRCKFKIDDNYTVCTFTGVSHAGKGTVFDAYWDGASWVDLGETVTPGEYVTSNSSAAVVVDFGVRRPAYVASQAGVSITSVTLANAANIPTGETVILRITNSAASDITIAGWSASIKFADGLTAPTTLAAYKKLVLQLLSIGGGVFVVTSAVSYT